MLIERKHTADLIPADYNPRKDLKPGDPEYDKLKRSMEQFGYVEPVIWNKATGRVVGGHQRLKVLMDMGVTEVECVVVEMDEEREKALNIALNKISGDWDKDKLMLLISDLQGADFDVSLTGFDPAEIDDLFKDSLKDGVKDDEFDVDAELQKPTITKAGDVWTLGRHRLVCGDSTKPETFSLLMEGLKANLVITDPPYNVNYEGGAGKIKNDNMENAAFYDFLLAAFQNTEEAMADDASIYVFHADTEGLNFRKAFSDAGFYLSGTCIWKKQSLVLGRSPYQWQHEPILFGWKKKGRHQWYTGRKESTIWEFDKPKKNKDHPTMKPVPLLAYPILNSSMSNAIVLDPFGGSGSTLIACEQTDRVCRTIELDEKFCDVIVKRYIEQVGSADSVSLQRAGLTYRYDEVAGDDAEDIPLFWGGAHGIEYSFDPRQSFRWLRGFSFGRSALRDHPGVGFGDRAVPHPGDHQAAPLYEALRRHLPDGWREDRAGGHHHLRLPLYRHEHRRSEGRSGREAIRPILPGHPHHSGNEGCHPWQISKIHRMGERPRRVQLQPRRGLQGRPRSGHRDQGAGHPGAYA